VSKLAERLVKGRLYHILEHKNFFNPDQSGFRGNHSTEDQILRITQAVADGFERRQKTVMVLVDFSRAFDKVWRTGLYVKMIRAGIPRCFIAWIRAWLTDRQACVRLNDVRSRFRNFREGTPQGAVLSPLLFNIYINDITARFPPGVQTSLFADDLAMWCSDSSVEEAEDKLQHALDALHEWADEWKLEVSIEKTEGTLFSLDPLHAKSEMKLRYNGSPLEHTFAPLFLGVTFDRTLTFRSHIAEIEKRMKKRMNILRAASGTSWGADASDLRTVYIAYIQSCAEYGAAAWMPGTARKNLDRLEIAQRQAARIITGCLRSTPTVALTREADLVPFQHRRNKMAAMAVQRHSREIPGDRLQGIIQPGNRPRARLKKDPRRGWADAGIEESRRAGLLDLPVEPALVVPSKAPWEARATGITFCTALASAATRTEPSDVRLAAARETLRLLPPADISVFTDGSADEGITNGGSGAVIYDKDGVVQARLTLAAGKYCSSYRAELIAIELALDHLLSRRTSPAGEVRICSDSKSALERLSRGPHRQSDILCDRIWTKLSRITTGGSAHVTMQWVPGHAGLPGNEEADVTAKRASNLPQGNAHVDLATIKAALRRRATADWISSTADDKYTKTFGTGRATLGDRLGLTRRESVELARLRTGHSTLLQAYRHRIGLADSDTCPDCSESPEDVQHLFCTCPAKSQIRNQIFNSFNPPLDDVLKDARRAVSYLRRLGRL
jgi:ribonuclease HI